MVHSSSCSCLLTHGLMLISSLKFSGALLRFRLSASIFSLVQVIWFFSGNTSMVSSSSSEYKLPILISECLSFTSWAYSKKVMRPQFKELLLYVFGFYSQQKCHKTLNMSVIVWVTKCDLLNFVTLNAVFDEI